VKSAAQKLGISIWTARKMAYLGEIASVKIGVKLLIPDSELERLVREGLRPRRASCSESRPSGGERQPEAQ
jgi:excisionase family DNA binding protein